MNYRTLLKKYMADIITEEGTDFVNSVTTWGYTDEEKKALLKISAELDAEEEVRFAGAILLDPLTYLKTSGYKPNV